MPFKRYIKTPKAQSLIILISSTAIREERGREERLNNPISRDGLYHFLQKPTHKFHTVSKETNEIVLQNNTCITALCHKIGLGPCSLSWDFNREVWHGDMNENPRLLRLLDCFFTVNCYYFLFNTKYQQNQFPSSRLWFMWHLQIHSWSVWESVIKHTWTNSVCY